LNRSAISPAFAGLRNTGSWIERFTFGGREKGVWTINFNL